jgi:DNA-binding transcriptional ArsR family regulator
MVTGGPDARAARVAAAIGEPARARMLYSLSDGRARTSTELAAIAAVAPSTASVHLQRLKACDLVKAVAQGKHRYYTLGGAHVAAALEALSVVAGGADGFVPTAPRHLRTARTCYDHIAGSLGVRLHDRLVAAKWLEEAPGGASYGVTAGGAAALAAIGIDIGAARALRRRFAFPCLDWSERRPHLGGALGAAVLDLALRRRWVSREPGSRALTVTPSGRRELAARLGLTFADV